ncbi:unnamed protein product [Paramecium sonneborni]|uniref:Uncharacterized protein n=1 Tax=Paramecium sonneborni TaxID=65129 RepID=A0A8S1N8M7_9CILI|nr:unnamed protein product [Paramecium sonneborni]CAD8085823.1 unnamed protein product [Paramecium sonneborni]
MKISLIPLNPSLYLIKYNPNCSKYQYNVEIEGVVFDVLAPCDLLKEIPLETIEMEE